MHFHAAVDEVERRTDRHVLDLGWEIRQAVEGFVDDLEFEALLDLAKHPDVYRAEMEESARWYVKQALFYNVERRVSCIPGYHENPWP